MRRAIAEGDCLFYEFIYVVPVLRVIPAFDCLWRVLGAAGIRNGAASYLEPISSVRKILVAQGTLEAEEHTMAFFRSFKSSFTGSATAFNRTAGNIVSTIWARKGGTMASRREFDNMSRRILFSL